MLREPEASEKAIKSFSHRVMRRLRAAGDGGRAFSLEDIQQELKIAWIKASDSYEPETGVPFQAYLMNGMRMHINREIEKHIERRHTEVLAVSLNSTVGEDTGRATLADVIPDDRNDFNAFEEDQHFEYAIRNLKPRARLFVTLLREQPDELMKEIICLKRKSDYGREQMGINSPATVRLAASTIFDFMDASNKERTEIMKELRGLGERVCRSMTR